MPRDPVSNTLNRIKRGLAGYVSYLAACEMNESFTEYILYEPTLRILTARGWAVRCEFRCPGFPVNPKGGDVKKLDFSCTRDDTQFAIEMKWARERPTSVASDIDKLQKYLAAYPGSRGFLFVFGRKSHVALLNYANKPLTEIGSPVYAEFGVTRFGCRNYEVKK